MLTSWDFGMAGAGCNPFLHKHAHGPTILFEVSLATVSHASSRLGQAQHETRQRQFVHIEVTAPDLDQAASIHPSWARQLFSFPLTGALEQTFGPKSRDNIRRPS